MIQSMRPETIVETLLNSLEAERYVRGPLLHNIVDELSCSPCFAPAASAARAMLEMLETGRLIESEFAVRVDALRQLVHALGAPESGEVLVRDSLARAVPQVAAHASTASAA